MPMNAMEQVMRAEQQARTDKTEAETRVAHALAEAERVGREQLQKARNDAAEQGRELLAQAEERAQKTAAEIAQSAERESDALRAAAKAHLGEAADYIVGKVVDA